MLWRLAFWKKPCPAAALVIDLLRMGRDWHKTHAHLTHKSGVSIWILNRWYGFEMAIDGRPAATGGQKVHLDWYSRSALIAATEAYLAGRPHGADRAAIALAERIQRLYAEEAANVVPF